LESIASACDKTMSRLFVLTMLLAVLPVRIAPHQQATFGDVVGGAGDPAHPVVEAADAFQQQQQQHPGAEGHGHGHGHEGGAKAFHEHAKDRDHIMKDMEGVVNKPESEMSQEELQFHYFKLHDSNNDNLLDGWELMFALNHDDSKADEKKVLSDKEISDMLDPIFKEDDRNQDGFISYAEFMDSIK